MSRFGEQPKYRDRAVSKSKSFEKYQRPQTDLDLRNQEVTFLIK